VRAEPGLSPPATLAASGLGPLAEPPAPSPSAPPLAARPTLLATGGVALDLGAGFAAPRVALALDVAPVPSLPALTWRVEAELLGAPPPGLPAAAPGVTVSALGGGLLTGVAHTRELPGGGLRFVSAAVGLRAAGTRAGGGRTELALGPVLRVAAGAGQELGWGTPFVEAGFSATGGAMVGARLALTVSIGFRVGKGR
jgi:hypothetical protein